MLLSHSVVACGRTLTAPESTAGGPAWHADYLADARDMSFLRLLRIGSRAVLRITLRDLVEDVAVDERL